MASLFTRLWQAVSSAPIPQRTAARDALIRADLHDETDAPIPGTEHVSAAEVRRALEWLLTEQHQRRPHQRRRRALTYRQRDQVAAILLRLARSTKRETAVTAHNREKWIKETIGELNKLSAGTAAEHTDWAAAIEQEANAQEDEYGDNSEEWDQPRDVAQRFIDDHHGDDAEQEETP